MARTTEQEAVQETPNFEIDLENVEGNKGQGTGPVETLIPTLELTLHALVRMDILRRF